MKTILLMDDSLLIQKVVKLSFAAKSNYQLHICQDPTQAVRMVKELNPDVILAYIRFSGEANPQFFSELVQRPNQLIIYAESDESLEKFEALGFHDFLRKPFNTDELRECVDKLANHEDATRANHSQPPQILPTELSDEPEIELTFMSVPPPPPSPRVTKAPISQIPSVKSVFPQIPPLPQQQSSTPKEPLLTMDLSFLDENQREQDSVGAPKSKHNAFENYKAATPQEKDRAVELAFEDSGLELSDVAVVAKTTQKDESPGNAFHHQKDDSFASASGLNEYKINELIDDALFKALERAIPAKISEKIEKEWPNIMNKLLVHLKQDLEEMKTEFRYEFKKQCQRWIETEARPLSKEIVKHEIQLLLADGA